MTARPKRTISNRLNAAQVAISNTLADAEILARVSDYGYTAARMQEGQQLSNAARQSLNDQVAALGEQRRAGEAAQAAESQARAAFQALALLSRSLFGKDSSQCASLGLLGQTPQSAPAFLTAAVRLFDNAYGIAEIARALANYGYDTSRLERERAAIDAFDRAYRALVAAKGAAQQATRDQTAARAALNKWLSLYLSVAKIALRDKPQLLEKIGGKVRATRTPAQQHHSVLLSIALPPHCDSIVTPFRSIWPGS